LANTLFHADVLVNYGSTTTIEACIYDTPVVNIAYDSDDLPPILGSVHNIYRQEHYRRIVDTGGVRLARSPQELVDLVRSYLTDPLQDQEGRHRIVREQAEPLDGQSARRTAEHVLSWLM
jgi:CDP-glycerol glycerophosphotransferase (TagB/SpsB family)